MEAELQMVLSHHMGAELNLGPLKKQKEYITTEPHLQPCLFEPLTRKVYKKSRIKFKYMQELFYEAIIDLLNNTSL